MKINNSAHSSQSLQAIQRVAPQNQAKNIQAQVESVVSHVENSSSSNSQNQQSSRLVSDKATIALVEQQLYSQSSRSNAYSAEERKGFSQYDEPSKRNQSAVSAYQTVDNIAQRESIEQIFGVNLFA